MVCFIQTDKYGTRGTVAIISETKASGRIAF
jgi:hypothetical protein